MVRTEHEQQNQTPQKTIRKLSQPIQFITASSATYGGDKMFRVTIQKIIFMRRKPKDWDHVVIRDNFRYTPHPSMHEHTTKNNFLYTACDGFVPRL